MGGRYVSGIVALMEREWELSGIQGQGGESSFIYSHLRLDRNPLLLEEKSKAPETIRSVSELEGADDAPYVPRQYASLAAVIQALLRAYPTLDRDRIRGHMHIAPGRKTDPGPWFDWSWLRMMIEAKDSQGRSG